MGLAKIEIGREIIRSFGPTKQVWNITRIEMQSNGDTLCIFACPNHWYKKHIDSRDKLYRNDELIFKYDTPIFTSI